MIVVNVLYISWIEWIKLAISGCFIIVNHFGFTLRLTSWLQLRKCQIMKENKKIDVDYLSLLFMHFSFRVTDDKPIFFYGCSLRWNYLVGWTLLLWSNILERSLWNLKMRKELYRLMIVLLLNGFYFILLFWFSLDSHLRFWWHETIQQERDRLFAEVENLAANSDGQAQKLPDVHLQKLKSLEAQVTVCRIFHRNFLYKFLLDY